MYTLSVMSVVHPAYTDFITHGREYKVLVIVCQWILDTIVEVTKEL